MPINGLWRASIFALALTASLPVHAQRAAENPLAAAQDAFGTSIGNESIGLYTASSARGFSPTDAGNSRLGGLYFDRQGPLPNRLIRGTTIRVGIASQSYPFAAPTGIADYQLRLPGDKYVTSVLARYGTYDSFNLEADVQIPVVQDKLSIGFGGNGGYSQSGQGRGDYWGGAWAIIGRIRPTDSIEIVPFVSHEVSPDWETPPRIYVSGTTLPPRINRDIVWGQDWMDLETRTTQAGVISRGAWDDWLLQVGLYRSSNESDNSVALDRNTQPDGTAARTYIGYPNLVTTSYSGEIRLSRVIREGDRRHTFHATMFGRDVDREFGGTQSVNGGIVRIGVYAPIPEIHYTYPPVGKDKVQQENFGLSYGLQWLGIGEISAGIQQALYDRALDNPALNRSSTTNSTPLLYNVTATALINDRLSVYASYTRGLEDSAQAPERATNLGETAPATITQQMDAGIRYIVSPNFKVVAGAFRIVKPLYDLDRSNLFTNVGDVTHEGFEFSASGKVTNDLTVIGGLVLLFPTVSGQLVDAGLIGDVPPQQSARSLRLNVQYEVPFLRSLLLDAQMQHDSSQYTDPSNILQVPSLTSFDMGARYRFLAWEAPATLRFQVFNVTNVYRYTLGGGRRIVPNEARRVQLQLTVDL